VLTILLDENVEGYHDYLSRLLFSPVWGELSSVLDVQVRSFAESGLAKGTPDEHVWEFCQRQRFYLITDNRNQDKADSLQSMIRTRNLPTSVPVFTISDIQRFRSDRDYAEAVAAKLLEYLMDADKIGGVGRLYLP
jgi:hypothetical protein